MGGANTPDATTPELSSDRPATDTAEALIESLLSSGETLTFAELSNRFRRVRELSPGSDVHLLSHAIRRGHGNQLTRALKLLAAESDARRLVMPLMPLMRSDDPRIRSQVAILLARGSRSLSWVMQHMKDPDARVRANVIEGVSIWLQDRVIFLKAAADRHHRIAGNGLMALLRLRDGRGREFLDRALIHRDWHFRAAALWAVGASGNTDFLPLTEHMRNDPHPAVRWNALRAMATLKRTMQGASTLEVNADSNSAG